MKCPACSQESPDGARYCAGCGAKFGTAAPLPDHSTLLAPPGHFSDHELGVLLDINRRSVAGESNASVTQTDIDKLFG
ncbi:MAG: zinc ribbon domain-containing protein [Bacteroidetes bacterium]|nr:MAG: zinc ribbon domain-containing protein [Bacteroidota bacterium]